MEKDLSNFRQIYSLDELLEKDILQNPMEQFQKWFFEAQNSDTEREVNAMSVATLGKDGFPKTRVVLLKKYTHEGFIFYSNYLSEKGKAIEENPHICLSFFWAGLERQVIIKGIAEKLAENLSEQSSIIPSREYLQEKLSLLEKKYENQDIPRPAFWGGYLVRPVSIEFWQGRPNRLHDRIRYSLTDTYDWKIERLSP